MMATTHALAGAAVAAVTAVVAPDLAPVAIPAALAGGVFPDLDLYADHRKRLHFPVYYSIFAAATLVVAWALPGDFSVALAFFLVAAALHSVMDVFGGGLELRPWLGESDRAVYDHFHGHWIAPRRWIRYDGAPEDFLLGCALALPVLASVDGILVPLVLATVAVSGVYALLRKHLVALSGHLLLRVPDDLLEYVPERFIEDITN